MEWLFLAAIFLLLSDTFRLVVYAAAAIFLPVLGGLALYIHPPSGVCIFVIYILFMLAFNMFYPETKETK